MRTFVSIQIKVSQLYCLIILMLCTIYIMFLVKQLLFCKLVIQRSRQCLECWDIFSQPSILHVFLQRSKWLILSRIPCWGIRSQPGFFSWSPCSIAQVHSSFLSSANVSSESWTRSALPQDADPAIHIHLGDSQLQSSLTAAALLMALRKPWQVLMGTVYSARSNQN